MKMGGGGAEKRWTCGVTGRWGGGAIKGDGEALKGNEEAIKGDEGALKGDTVR